ncbi:hypothetical protein VNO77_18866 [Canavalia gladiata]|uniref:Uncharacterized protein n=1 Tax=Canavalia gladiata TaxID=3824 RepID=A0AAN9LLL0_CANGL
MPIGGRFRRLLRHGGMNHGRRNPAGGDSAALVLGGGIASLSNHSQELVESRRNLETLSVALRLLLPTARLWWLDLRRWHTPPARVGPERNRPASPETVHLGAPLWSSAAALRSGFPPLLI